MKLLTDNQTPGVRIVALGTFDGVHAGHRDLLRKGMAYARKENLLLQAATFNRHPLEVIHPEAGPKLLTTLTEKIRIFHGLGIPEVRLIPFDRDMAGMEPAEFLRWLRERVRFRAVIAGWNYTFGKGGRGTAEMLQEDGARNGYDVLIEPPVRSRDGMIVSSSRIRELIRSGDTEEAGRLMKRPYTLSGTVRNGKQIGGQLGFATANLETNPRKLLPAFGVYVCSAEYDHRQHPAVVNIGTQPTIPSGQVTVEVHILDENPDLYGRPVRVSLYRRLREERKFSSPDRLAEQIGEDARRAMRYFSRRKALPGRDAEDCPSPCPDGPEVL